MNSQSTTQPTLPVTLVNCMAVKPGMMDQFIAAQRAFATRRRPGLDGGCMYRGSDGRTAILVSRFASAAVQQEVLQSEAFQAHLAQVRPMVESSSPLVCEVAYSYGTLS